MGIRRFIDEKIIVPVVKLLKQGISPEKIALSIAWGVMLGIFPVLGTTTILCTAAAIILRLNFPIIQMANWLVYPLQLAFLFPFFFAGAHLFGSGQLTHDAQDLMMLFQSDLINALVLLWEMVLHAVMVWLFVSPFVIFGVFILLRPVLKKLLEA